mgnify:CR=1 FL=1
MSDYILPEVWENPTSMGGTWGGLNQPTAGARFEQTLPKGDQPFQLYTFPTPNGIKATIMLEELKELGVTQLRLVMVTNSAQTLFQSIQTQRFQP